VVNEQSHEDAIDPGQAEVKNGDEKHAA